MVSPPCEDQNRWRSDLSRRVAAKEARKLRARREKGRLIWRGLGTLGLVGWSVTVPTLLGLAAGMWIDRTWPSRFSWTLTLLIGGVIAGCWNAWYWIGQERRDIERNGDDDRNS